MSKSDEKLNLLRDIGVYEYVAGDQSAAAQAQFEDALSNNPELEDEVAAEQELRTLIEMTQPASVVSENNIDMLFERIDANQNPEADLDSFSVPANDEATYQARPKNNVIGFAVAASLFLAVFFAVNFNNNDPQLEPEFRTLTSSDSKQVNTIDFESLVAQNRVITLVLTAPASTEEIEALLNQHQLQRLNHNSLNQSIITAYANETINDATLSKLKADQLIKDTELFKF